MANKRNLNLPPITPSESSQPSRAKGAAADYHGTVGGYTNHGCRCDLCRGAYKEYARERSALRRGLPTPDRVHGTVGGYTNWHCRCDRCREAMTSYYGTLRREGRTAGTT